MRKNTTISCVVSSILVLTLMFGISIPSIASELEKRAVSSQTKFILDDRQITFDAAYNIEDNNYIQLRSVAQMLNGTKSQFNVYWDDLLKQAVIETGKPFTGVKPIVKVVKNQNTNGITIKNTQISNIRTSYTKQVDEFTLEDTDEIFFEITFDVLTSNPYMHGRSEHFLPDFLKNCEGISGKIYSYSGKLGNENSDIYQNQKDTASVYITIPETEKIKSITFSDGRGSIDTFFVN